MPGIRTYESRCFVCGFFLFLLCAILSGRVIWLQSIGRDMEIATKNATSQYITEVFPAHRGLIIDRNEDPLVVNVPFSDVYADKKHLSEVNTICRAVAYKRLRFEDEWIQATKRERKKMLDSLRLQLANTSTPNMLITEHNAFIVSLLAKPLGMTKAELRSHLENPKRQKDYLKKKIKQSDANHLKHLIKENYIRGIYLEKHLTRHYHSPYLAPHLLGYAKNYIGASGLEAKFEDTLSGVDGFYKRKSSPGKLSIYSEQEEFLLPTQGLNIKLSLDSSIQAIVEEELEAGLKEAVCKKGCAIIIKPDTGEVLAMAARPHYNLNTREGVAQGSANYCLRSTFEPGSTMKVLTAAAALNEGHVNIHYPLINCENGYLKEKFVTVRDEYPRQYMSLSQILAKSSNIGTYKLGRQVGRKRFEQYLEDFGLKGKTGLGIGSEARTKATIGNIPQDFANATFGYVLAVTPMHMALAYATIANDGMRMQPNMVRSIVTSDNTLVEDYPPKEIKRVIKPDVARALRKAMVAVVSEGGSGVQAAVPGYKVAGKTGTARKWENGAYRRGRYVCSFGGMLPAHAPEFICYIVVDDPLINPSIKNRYGGTLAAPIFRKIATRLAVYLEIPPTEPIPKKKSE